MSETVHYRGKARVVKVPVGKTLNEVVTNILKAEKLTPSDFYDNIITQLCDECYQKYFFHHKSQTLYKLENYKYDADDDIIMALKDRSVIRYELRYYNGGAGFDECLQEAFDKIE